MNCTILATFKHQLGNDKQQSVLALCYQIDVGCSWYMCT